MIPFVLPNVLLIAENCTDEEYSQLIFPQLKPVLKIQDPVQVKCKIVFISVLSQYYFKVSAMGVGHFIACRIILNDGSNLRLQNLRGFCSLIKSMVNLTAKCSRCSCGRRLHNVEMLLVTPVLNENGVFHVGRCP